MARHIRIPFLADLILTDDPDEIRELANQVALDRGFRARGPLINRILARRIKAALTFERTQLPSVQMRGDPQRQQASDRLSKMFAPGNWDSELVKLIAAHVRGTPGRPAGELAQEVMGRVFDSDYTANADTWAAAQAIDEHLQSRNPIMALLRKISGAVPRAQSALRQAASGDPGAMHGTGIAVHNLVLSLERMQTLWANESMRSRLAPEEAALSVIAAPRTVMRAAAEHEDTIGGRVRPATLVALNTRAAADKAMDADLAFLGSSWSRCPAQHWVMALLAEVWREAGDV
ncbi:MAG: hypothetical protein ABJI96_07685 [Paracoccaceae bacterium]